MAYAQLLLRPNVKPTEQVHTLIAPNHCWHFDAWLFGERGTLVLLCETRAGGRELLTSNAYIWDGENLRYVARLSDDLRALPMVTLQDKALWSRFEELNMLHHKYIVPMSARVPDKFKCRSVALHYVRAPSLAPFDGTEVNMTRYERKCPDA